MLGLGTFLSFDFLMSISYFNKFYILDLAVIKLNEPHKIVKL